MAKMSQCDGMKDIKGYEGLYAVTSCGKVWSHRRTKYLSAHNGNSGYSQVILYKNGKAKAYSVHRLVAMMYIPNPENKSCVNHIDENKLNNALNNLEWVTHKENINHGTCIKRIVAKLEKPVLCVEQNKIFSSVHKAGRETRTNYRHISDCARGKRKTSGGYHWQYV